MDLLCITLGFRLSAVEGVTENGWRTIILSNWWYDTYEHTHTNNFKELKSVESKGTFIKDIQYKCIYRNS